MPKETQPTNSNLAQEMNPWVDGEHLEAALLHRGAIVAAWGYIEQTINELCIRASRLPRYAALRESFPYRHKSKFAFLIEAASIPGPLQPFGRWFGLLSERAEKGREFRNLMAHGKMRMPHPNFGIKFKIWKTEDGELTVSAMTLTFDDLVREANKVCRLSRLVARRYGKHFGDDVLPVWEPKYVNP